MTRYNKLKDGEWTEIEGRLVKRQCCDCGLVHLYEYRIRKGKHIKYRAFRETRATGQVRRHKKEKMMPTHTPKERKKSKGRKKPSKVKIKRR
jgi:hypothetical protein